MNMVLKSNEYYLQFFKSEVINEPGQNTLIALTFELFEVRTELSIFVPLPG